MERVGELGNPGHREDDDTLPSESPEKNAELNEYAPLR
jgi:hypothetical protein